MNVSFVKMSGAGNDFLVLDNRDGRYDVFNRDMIRDLCERRTGVGADGLILIEGDQERDFFMRYFNSDGGEAEMCANGARCAVLFASRLFQGQAVFQFGTKTGTHGGRVLKSGVDAHVEIGMPPPSRISLSEKLTLENETLTYGFIVVGVPHVVVHTDEEVEKARVKELGSLVRYHERYRPTGTNVNFFEVQSGNTILVRTYERGVEDETLACGTGATASAILSTLWGYTKPPVSCLTRGGAVLTVSFDHSSPDIPPPDTISSLTLRGEAKVVYEGVLSR